jgi:hypothetical protein
VVEHAVVKAKPELASVESFKTVLSGNREAISKLSKQDLEKILVATLTGMFIDEFKAQVKAWLETARDPRWGSPYTELTYQPMQELMTYLRANGYKTYIVTGGGQEGSGATRKIEFADPLNLVGCEPRHR